MFTTSPWLMASIIFLIILFSFLMSFRRRNTFVISPPAVTAGILFLYKFYSLLVEIKEAPFYLNPFSVFIICGGVPLEIFVTIFAIRQMRLVFLGLTTKQFESISKEAIIEFERFDSKYKINKNMPFKEKFSNLISFLKRPNSESLIKFIE
jgi:hypothetical protein